MKWFIVLFPIIYGMFFISKDYRVTKGFVKQKILHVVSLIFLIVSYSSSFKIFNVISDFSGTYNNFQTQQSYFPVIFNFSLMVANYILGIVLFLSAWLMFTRNDKARRILIKLLPFSIILALPNIEVFLSNPNKYSNGSSTILAIYIISFIFILLFQLGIFFLYRSKSMIDFFNSKKNN